VVSVLFSPKYKNLWLYCPSFVEFFIKNKKKKEIDFQLSEK